MSATKTILPIDVLEISANGMAFIIKNGSIEVGDLVEIILDSDTHGRAIRRGKVLEARMIGQTIAAGSRQSIRHFSIQFQAELESELLESIRTMRLTPLAV